MIRKVVILIFLALLVMSAPVLAACPQTEDLAGLSTTAQLENDELSFINDIIDTASNLGEEQAELAVDQDEVNNAPALSNEEIGLETAEFDLDFDDSTSENETGVDPANELELHSVTDDLYLFN